MKLMHYVKKENSGLARSALELVKYEEKQGHTASIQEPGGGLVWGRGGDCDIELIHSQLPSTSYFNNKPKIMWQHGEPISSVGNGISMKAIVDLAAKMDALICMRKEEYAIWNTIKRTFVVQKGIDLEVYHPLEGITERLSGAPSVLYIENWRGNRNPLYLCVAMEKVWKKYPEARLHLYNCQDKRMLETFRALIAHNKWWPFIRSLQGPVNDVNTLYNRVDMVVSCLYPLYAGKAYIGAGYKEEGYPWTCELHPDSMADAIVNCWENYSKIDYRKWAEQKHDVNETVKQSIEIYKRYL
jgi:hypothetical protein